MKSPLRRPLAPILLTLLAFSSLPPVFARSPVTLTPLARYALSASPSPPTNLRWASDASFYLARRNDGIAELALREGLPQLRAIAPKSHDPAAHIYYLAATDTRLFYADRDHAFATRPLKPTTFVLEQHEAALTTGLDLQGDRILLLGAGLADNEDTIGTYDPSGAIAWTGDVGDLSHLMPLLFDSEGPGAPRLSRCLLLEPAGGRFLPNGSIFVVPGTEPGAYLYGPGGNLLTSWTNKDLGITDQCALPSKTFLAEKAANRALWRNRGAVLDAALAVGDHPALIVRSLQSGRPTWTLKILHGDRADSYNLAIPGATANDRLLADVRGQRLIVLRRPQDLARSKAAAEVLLFALPKP